MKKDLKAALAAVKALLFAEQDNTPAAAEDANAGAAIEFKGKDGKAYKAAKLEVGATVEVADEAGAYTPVSDGNIEVEDGSIIAVKDGKIEAITAPVEAAKVDDVPTDLPPAEKEKNGEVSKADFDALNEKVEGLVQLLATMAEKNNLSFTAMFEAMEVISETSDATPAGKDNNSAFKDVVSAKDLVKQSVKAAFAAANKK
ncbi:MAG: hypothetical protein ABIN67_13780 [Ferruginibacter sp.]